MQLSRAELTKLKASFKERCKACNLSQNGTTATLCARLWKYQQNTTKDQPKDRPKRTQLTKLKASLKERCKANKLSQHGTTASLCNRLWKYQQKTTTGQQAETPKKKAFFKHSKQLQLQLPKTITKKSHKRTIDPVNTENDPYNIPALKYVNLFFNGDLKKAQKAPVFVERKRVQTGKNVTKLMIPDIRSSKVGSIIRWVLYK